MTRRIGLPTLTPGSPSHSIVRDKLRVALLELPLRVAPSALTGRVVVQLLNTVLAQALEEGDLDFLAGRQVSIAVADIDLRFALNLQARRLQLRPWCKDDDLNLSGDVVDFLRLASRAEDADTLFFQRRLKMQGNTELGLEVKNLLDGLDYDSVPFQSQIDFALAAAVRLYDKARPATDNTTIKSE